MWSRSISAGRNKAGALAFLAAFAAAAPAAAQDSGAPADTLRYPFVAALSRGDPSGRVYFCAGALVAPDWVLTAAHCFYTPRGGRIPATDLWVEVGSSRLAEVPEAGQVRVARIVAHPDYDPASQANDIALVRLERIAGPLIAEIQTGGAAPRRAIVLGFGSFYEGRLAANALLSSGAPAAQVSDRLRQAAVETIAPEACAARLGDYASAPAASQLCAAAGPRETCIGDSGAPLVIEGAGGADRVAGIVSLGSGCGAERPVTVYTRVAAYAGWIAATLAGR